MAEADPIRSLEESAERAAQAGDLAGAASLLREAADLQQSTLGAQHPDLAHTFNNLGVVHERLGQLDEAEASYRRAHAIALSAFPAGHPFVETSGRNLREFCDAHRRPVTAPRPEVAAPAPVIAAPQPRVVAPAAPTASVAAPFNTRRLVFAACGLVVLAIALALGARFWSESTAGAGYVGPEPTPPAASSTPPAPSPAAPAPPPVAAPPEPAVGATAPVVEPRVTAPAVDAPTVVDARICSRLSTSGASGWECDEVAESTNPGTLFFYTRVKSATDTTVQHRWYLGDRLWQSVDLPVRANRSAGFRTFSRQTVTLPRAGDWRVELRGPDGALLGEERVRVRADAP